jgi:MFS family permease
MPARCGMLRGMTVGRLRVLLGFMSFGAFWGAWGVLLPFLQRQAHVGEGELGVAVLMIGLGALCSMRASGAAIDRFGRRAVTFCLVAMALAGFLPALATSGTSLIGVLLLTGAASGAMDVAVNALGTEEEARTGLIMNAAHASFSAAVVIAGLVTGIVLGHGGTARGVLGGISISALGIAAAIHLLDRQAPAPPAPARGSEQRRAAWSRPLLVLGGLCALAYLVENAWQSWAAVLLRSSFHSSAEVSSLGPVLFAASAATGRALGHRVLAHKSRRSVLVGGAVTGAVGTFAAALAPSTPLMLAGVVIAGLGTSLCAPTILSLAGEQAGRASRSSAISVVTTLGYAGFLIGPAAVGLTASVTSLRIALAGVGAVAVTLAGCTMLVRAGFSGGRGELRREAEHSRHVGQEERQGYGGGECVESHG